MAKQLHADNNEVKFPLKSFIGIYQLPPLLVTVNSTVNSFLPIKVNPYDYGIRVQNKVSNFKYKFEFIEI